MKLKPSKPYYNIDPVTKQVYSDALYDCYIDESDALNIRFGLTEFADLATGAPGDGLFWWDKLAMPIAVSGGRAFTFNSTGVVTELTGCDFESGTPVVFAAGQKVDNSGFLMAANGGPINYSTGGVFDTIPSPAPQAVTHVIYNNLRFLANEKNTARFSFSDISTTTGEFDPLYWDAIENPLTGDTRGDNIEGLYQAWDDIAVWGSEGRELWQVTNGEPPLESRLGAFCEAGLIAPYSVKRADNTFFALCNIDEKPAVVRLSGNDPVIISIPIEKILDTFTTLNDAIGDVVSVGGQSFYILTFPTEAQTWVYNIKKDYWCQWSWWNLQFAERETFLGRHFIYARQWGKHLCMSRRDGKIYEVDPAGLYDGTDLIRAEWQTAWFDGGVTQNKILARLRIQFKRGQGDITGNEPIAMVRWRDNGKREWKGERHISLGKMGEYDFYRTMWNLGMFRSRQMSLIITDPSKTLMVEMEPDIQVLGM